MTTPNKTLIYKKTPVDFPVPGEHIAVENRPIDLSKAPSGGLIIKNLYASFDPYLRGRMRDPTIKSYMPAFEIDGPISNGCIGKVVKSDVSGFKEGDLVVAGSPIAEYAEINSDVIAGGSCVKVDNKHNLDLSFFLGPLGMPGLTAWSSLYKIGQPKKGETIFISSAAGAVGQVVGQVAKHEGLRVIGSVGSDEKLDFITKELGFDAGTNYKKESTADALKRLAPEGIDIYYENVGGEMLDDALAAMKLNGRVVACGMISQYNVKAEERYGAKNLMMVVAKRLTIQGFLVGDKEFGPVYYKDHQVSMQKWLADGSFKAKIDVTEGIDNAGEGFVGMLKGKNFGKAVLKIADA